MDALKGLCIEMRTLEDRKTELEEQLKLINQQYDIVRLRKIPQLMESLQIRNATFTGIGRVQLAADIYASTREGRKAEAIQWLRDLGYDEMVSETYNASSMKALFRRLIEQGANIPSDIFNVTPFTRASIVKR